MYFCRVKVLHFAFISPLFWEERFIPLPPTTQDARNMKELESIKLPILAELERYAALFDEVLTHEEEFMSQVLSYVRSRKGKMMRPVLVLLLAKELGTIGESTLRSAVTLELLHTSSLIHDDVVDESDERRGRASVHQIYDNKIAVLLGDYMLAQTLEQSALTGSVRVVEAVARLGATLAEGEIMQLTAVHKEVISESAYFSIITRKTASLFEACGSLAALSMHASEEMLQQYRRLGELIGLCFQIRDDIFDYYDDAAIGKPRGKDMAEGKLTLPVIAALKLSQSAEAKEVALRVKQGESTPEEREWLVEFTKENGGITYAEQKMQELSDEARQIVAGFSNEAIKNSLISYIDVVVGRNY